MLDRHCPRVIELESLSLSGRSSTVVRTHVETCAACARIVEDLRRDGELLAQLREAAEEGLDNEPREHVMELCEQVAAEVSRTTESSKRRNAEA